jgi:uncharacterized protein (TIGR03435 family)
MIKTFTAAAVLVLCSVAFLAGQDPGPNFEVVSIKRNTTGSGGMSAGSRPDGTWQMTNGTAESLLYSAFRIQNRDIIGLPEWAKQERYDVIARAGNRPSREEEELMMRGLLAERFKFRGHIEQREIPVFALVIARPDRSLPSGLVRLPVDCAALGEARRRGETVNPTPLPDGSAPCGYSMRGGTQLVLTSRGIPMERLADSLGSAAGRVVIDRTDLKGDYAFTLTYDLPRTDGGNGDIPTVFTALPEQLGLRLESSRAPVDTLVIDQLERPSQN